GIESELPGQFIVESSECGRTKMSSSKKEAFPQASTPTPEFNREKHKLEVKKMKLKKQKRRMKMTDRHDDIKRDSGDSDVEFTASTLPAEQPQDQWLNDLLGPPSGRQSQSSQLGSKSSKDSKEEKQAFTQGTYTLSSLITQVQDTIANYPLAFALIVAMAVLIGWFCRSSE
ncbi:hypothetical protein GCK32_004529, partial [Trichostrongylus colubriformis]